jgi:branched-chain amino acid transport system substrate-binding protein
LRGLVHRDVKPSNVLVDGRGHAYLADFGLSRRLADQAAGFDAGLSLGTPAYVAPEQIEGKEIDGRADQYSLACVLYECLSGERPFPRSSEAAVLFAHLEEAPPTLPGLEEVLPKALAKAPRDRYESCIGLVDAAADALGVTVRRRSLWPIAVAAAGVAVIAASAAAFLITRGSSGPAALPGADTLVRIDPATNAVADTLPVGRKSSDVAVSGRYVWAASFADGNVWRIDAHSHDTTQIPVRGSPIGVAAVPGTVLVSDGPEQQLVSLDPDQGTVTRVTGLAGSAPVAGGREGAWFADATEGIVGTLDPGVTLGERTTIAVPPDRSNLLTVYENFDDVAVGLGSIWVVGDAFGRTLWRLDPISKRVVEAIPLGFVPGAVAVGDDAVWVTSLLGDTIAKIDPVGKRIVRTIRVGVGVNDIAAGEGSVWVTSAVDRSLTRIEPVTGRVVARTPLEGVPGHVAVGSGGVWVTTGKPTPRIARGSIGIGVLADCNGPFAPSYEDALAGAELALIERGGRRAGPLVTDGVAGVRIAGKPVELAFGCTDGSSASTLAEARRLVEQAGVQIMVGPLGGNEGLALEAYERIRPDITFVNGSASAQQLDPPSNFYSFHTDGGAWMAGLGAYAYRTLGWRHAVTVVDGNGALFNWTQAAAFITEFCSLGGTIAKRVWVPPGTQDYSSVIAGMPRKGVDGVLAAGFASTTIALVQAYPPLAGRFATKLITGSLGYGPQLEKLSKRLSGSVGAAPFLGPHDRYVRDLLRNFRQIKEPQAYDLYYNGAMAATLEALDRVHGDLSGGERAFQAALAKLDLDTPIGRVRLDQDHEAVSPNYLFRFRTYTDGSLLKRIDGVEHTFGGHFQPTDPPPTLNTPTCKPGNPPPWAR